MERKAKILLVDDDADFADSTKIILESKPYEVIIAVNGDECLRKAREESPDLILLDIIMPVEDGFTAAEQLKHDPQLAKIAKESAALRLSEGIPVPLTQDDSLKAYRRAKRSIILRIIIVAGAISIIVVMLILLMYTLSSTSSLSKVMSIFHRRWIFSPVM